MKRMLFGLACAAGIIGLGLYFNPSKPPHIPPSESVPESIPQQTSEPTPSAIIGSSASGPESANGREQSGGLDQPVKARQLGIPAPAANESKLVLDQAIEILISSQTGFEKKQTIWKQLKETGKLDEAITALEQRMASDPQTAAYPAALGQAYLKKCAVIGDVRDQAILAMKADQTLETALTLEPSNWEARYTKAVGMSYWPAQLNKQQEVIEQFRTLIQQQEMQAPEPQFARSYTRLGDQYQKSGQADYAAQIWQRGAALFPNDEELKSKLAAAR